MQTHELFDLATDLLVEVKRRLSEEEAPAPSRIHAQLKRVALDRNRHPDDDPYNLDQLLAAAQVAYGCYATGWEQNLHTRPAFVRAIEEACYFTFMLSPEGTVRPAGPCPDCGDREVAPGQCKTCDPGLVLPPRRCTGAGSDGHGCDGYMAHVPGNPDDVQCRTCNRLEEAAPKAS